MLKDVMDKNNRRRKKQNNMTKAFGILVGAYAISCAFGGNDSSKQDQTKSATVVLSEKLENGSIVQELASKDGEAPVERRVGLTDEAWVKTKNGVTASYHLTVVAKGMILSEFDMNADGKIDDVRIRLVDGRRIVVADKDYDGKFETVTVEKAVSERPAKDQD